MATTVEQRPNTLSPTLDLALEFRVNGNSVSNVDFAFVQMRRNPNAPYGCSNGNKITGAVLWPKDAGQEHV